MTAFEETRRARASVRVGLRLRAQLRASGLDKLNVDITDLSPTGFQIDTVHRLALNSKVHLKIAGLGGLEAVVKWKKGDRYGFAFAIPLHDAVFTSVIAAAGD